MDLRLLKDNMATIIKLKDFNPGLVKEEMTAAGLLIRHQFTGFERVSVRLVTPSSGQREVSGDRVRQIFDMADSGEIRFDTDESNMTALSNLLDAHDSTGISVEQGEEDLDASALQELKTMFAGTIDRNRAVDLMVRLLSRESF